MSADNHAWIRPLKNGRWAVRVISSLYPEDEGWTDEALDAEFKDAPQFKTKDEAWTAAFNMIEEEESQGRYVEYGVALCPRKEHGFDESCSCECQSWFDLVEEET